MTSRRKTKRSKRKGRRREQGGWKEWEGEGGELSQQPEDMDGVLEEFEDVVLDQEGPGVGIHMFIVIVNTIDISALLTHRGQAPVPPSFSLFNRGTAGTSRRGAPGRNQLLLPLAAGREARHQ